MVSNDTIYVKPNIYELDEVIIEKNSEFNNMVRPILTDYALERHKEQYKINKDMFELKGKHDSRYWENNEILLLTNEMQQFINKVNTLKNKSDFKTQTNMR